MNEYDEDSTHSEHVKILDALSSNLKLEVARGLKLLDNCVSQIAQAKWILTTVDESLSGFSKGCPVCGILSEKEKQIIRGPVRDKQSNKASSPKRTVDNAIAPNKPKSTIQPQTRDITPAISTSAAKVQKPTPTHRVGPRSKTKPEESPVPKSTPPVPVAVQSSSSGPISRLDKPVNRPGPSSATQGYRPGPASATQKAKTIPQVIDIDSSSPSQKLPNKLNIVVPQTKVGVQLKDVKPYLRGSTKVNLNNLRLYDCPKTIIPLDLKFKIKIVKVSKPKGISPSPGAASRKFLASLKKSEEKKPKVSTSKSTFASALGLALSSTSDEDKPSIPPPKPKPVTTDEPKKKGSDSESDYDYNFAKSAPGSSTSSLKMKNKSILSSLSQSQKRRKHSSSDSDQDYMYKKKKSSKSIFKKKKISSSESESDDDDDEYGRRRKKKRRKDSTDKDKRQISSTSKSHGGSKSSSVVSSTRMTIPPKSSDSKQKEHKSRSRRQSSTSFAGSTTSIAKSDTNAQEKKKLPDTSKIAVSSTSVSNSNAAPAPKSSDESLISLTESASKPEEAAPKPKYRPGPASKKNKIVEAPTPIEKINNTDSQSKVVHDKEKSSESENSKTTASTNGIKGKKDPFAQLRSQFKGADTSQDQIKELVKKMDSAKKQSFTAMLLKAQAAKNMKIKNTNSLKSAETGVTTNSTEKTVEVNNDNTNSIQEKEGSAQNGEGNPEVNTPEVTQTLDDAEPELVVIEEAERQESTPVLNNSSSPEKSRDSTMNVEEDRIELGMDVISQCFNALEDKDDNEGSKTPPVPALPFTLSPMTPTLQDCVSPSGVEKYFQPPEVEIEPDQPDSAVGSLVEKVQDMLFALSESEVHETARLKFQDRIGEIFRPFLTEQEEELVRDDLEAGKWYLAKKKYLGVAMCDDTLAIVDWDQLSPEGLQLIIKELESPLL